MNKILLKSINSVLWHSRLKHNVLLILLSLIFLCLSAQLSMAKVKVLISSEPSGASVKWDGVFIGKTPVNGDPLIIDEVEKGDYSVELSLNGYKSESRPIKITSDSLDYPVHIILTKPDTPPEPPMSTLQSLPLHLELKLKNQW